MQTQLLFPQSLQLQVYKCLRTQYMKRACKRKHRIFTYLVWKGVVYGVTLQDTYSRLPKNSGLWLTQFVMFCGIWSVCSYLVTRLLHLLGQLLTWLWLGEKLVSLNFVKLSNLYSVSLCKMYNHPVAPALPSAQARTVSESGPRERPHTHTKYYSNMRT